MPGAVDYQVRSDHRNFYSQQSLAVAAAAFGGGAVMAHTDADEEIRQWYQDDVRSGKTDGIANVATHFGDGYLVVPTLGAALLLGELADEQSHCSVVGDWADRSLRAALVGVPPLLVTQSLTGASRPGESSAESDWIPLHDNNGVSGHAFMGAFPCITAAKMTDNSCEKAAWYFASTLPGWSRINDDAHYTSQVLLGWSLAYLACEAVDDTEQAQLDYRFTPVPIPDGAGIGIVFER